MSEKAPWLVLTDEEWAKVLAQPERAHPRRADRPA